MHHSVRIGTVSDTTAIVRLMKDLFYASVYTNHGTFSEKDARETTKKELSGNPKEGIIFVLEVNGVVQGVLVASSFAHAFNRSVLMAAEVGFWIDPEYRSVATIKALMRAYRVWAKTIGCTSILVGKLKSQGEPETYNIRKL